MVKEAFKRVTSYINPTGIPGADFAVNPYVGCPHKCAYCYADFMKRFTNHHEPWGEFLDVKICDKPIDVKKYAGKSILIGTVTDPYNPFEERYEITRKILGQLKDSAASVSIVTKSDLVVRDIDLLKQFKDAQVVFSISSHDDKFRKIMEPRAPGIPRRMMALQELHAEGIPTVIFMAPMFPGITDFRHIIEMTRGYVGRYWFSSLNLRPSYVSKVLDIINANYPHLKKLYSDIFVKKNTLYWDGLDKEIERYCLENRVKDYDIYFNFG